MKKIIITLLLVTTGCALFGKKTMDSKAIKPQYKEVAESTSQKSIADLKKRLMILPFLDTMTARPQNLRDNARSEVIKALNYQGKMIVIDSKDLSTDPFQFYKEGEYDLKSLAKEATQLGVSAVLEGKIMSIRVNRSSDKVGLIRQVKSEFECIVKVRIISARNAKELMNVTKTVLLSDSKYRVGARVDSDQLVGVDPQLVQSLVRDAFLDFTPKIMESLNQLEWSGRVAQIKGDLIYLNVGYVSGLQKGDILRVSEEGEEIYDPDNGHFIGKVPGRMKGTIEVVNFFGTDGAIAIIHSGAGFKENDQVELY